MCGNLSENCTRARKVFRNTIMRQQHIEKDSISVMFQTGEDGTRCFGM